MEVFAVSPVDQIRASLAEGVDEGSPVATQSTIAAAARAVARVLVHEQAAEEASLSLAQRRLLAELRSEMEAAAVALDQAVPERARCLLDPQPRARRKLLGRRATLKESVDWDSAVYESLAAIDHTVDLLADLAAGQPQDSAARAVAESTSRLLEQHKDRLSEAALRTHDD